MRLCHILAETLGYYSPHGVPTVVLSSADDRRFIAATEMHEMTHQAAFTSTSFGHLQVTVRFLLQFLGAHPDVIRALEEVEAAAMLASRVAHEAIATFTQWEYICRVESKDAADAYVEGQPAIYRAGCNAYRAMTAALVNSGLNNYQLSMALSDAVFQSSAVELIGTLLSAGPEQIRRQINAVSPDRRFRTLRRALRSAAVVDELIRRVDEHHHDPDLFEHAQIIGDPERVRCFAFVRAISDTCLPVYANASPASVDSAFVSAWRELRDCAEERGMHGLRDARVGAPVRDRKARERLYAKARFVIEKPPDVKCIVAATPLNANQAYQCILKLRSAYEFVYLHIGTPRVPYNIPLQAEQQCELVVVASSTGSGTLLQQLWLNVLRGDVYRLIKQIARKRRVVVVDSVLNDHEWRVRTIHRSSHALAWYSILGEAEDTLDLVTTLLAESPLRKCVLVGDSVRDWRTVLVVEPGHPTMLLPISRLGEAFLYRWIDETEAKARLLTLKDYRHIGGLDLASIVVDHFRRWGF